MRRSYSRTRRRQEATGRCFDRPSPGQHLEAGGGVNTAQHFDGENKENGLVKQLPTIVAASSKRCLIHGQRLRIASICAPTLSETVCKGEKSFESIRQPRPVRSP